MFHVWLDPKAQMSTGIHLRSGFWENRPETRTRMLVVYLGGDYRKQEWEKEELETSKKESGEKERVSTFAVLGNMDSLLCSLGEARCLPALSF